MKTFHLSDRDRTRFSVPGEYIFSIIDKQSADQSTDQQCMGTSGFPGRSTQLFVCSFSIGRADLVFYAPNASYRPVLSWLLKIKRCKNGTYLVIGDSVFEKVIIQNGELVHASIQPLPCHYEDEESVILYTQSPGPHSKELHSLVSPPKPVMCAKDSPLPNSEGIRMRIIPAALITICCIFVLSRTILNPVEGKNASSQNETPQNIPISAVLATQGSAEYMTGSHIVPLIQVMKAQLPSTSWIDGITVADDTVNIYADGKNMLDFVDSLSSSPTFSNPEMGLARIDRAQIDLAQSFPALLHEDTEQEIHIRLPRQAFHIPEEYNWTEYDQGEHSMYPANLAEKIRIIRNLKQGLENTSGEYITVDTDRDMVSLSLSAGADKIIPALKFISTTTVPLSQFSLQAKQESAHEITMSIAISIQNIQSDVLAPGVRVDLATPELAHENFLHNAAAFPEQDIRALDIRAVDIRGLFNRLQHSKQQDSQNFQANGLTGTLIPDYLHPMGTIELLDTKYFSFYDKRTGFTICLSPGESYGNWFLSSEGNHITQ